MRVRTSVLDGIHTAGKLAFQVGTGIDVVGGSLRAGTGGSASQLDGHSDTAHGELSACS